MSGHSKWSTIKRKKGITDQKRGQVFSKLSKIITLAVKEGGRLSDPEKNVRLRLAVERARAENMPKENIMRAIQKGSGNEGSNMQEAVYEGFGPDGVVLVITATTDNTNRTHSELKNILEKHGGKLGHTGSVLYLFDHCGIVVLKSTIDENVVFSLAQDLNALDIGGDADSYIVYIPFEKLGAVSSVLAGLVAENIEPFWRAKNPVNVSEKTQEMIGKLMELLEDHDDVDRVYTNIN